MNKKEKARKLTWKYFWQQKFKELTIVLGVGVLFTFIPYYFGKFLNYLSPKLFSVAEEVLVFGLWCMGFIILMFLFFSVMGIFEIIKSNWTKAKSRADKEVGI